MEFFCSKCGPQISSINRAWSWLEKQIQGLLGRQASSMLESQVLIRKEGKKGAGLRGLKRPPLEDSHIHSSWGTTVMGELTHQVPQGCHFP